MKSIRRNDICKHFDREHHAKGMCQKCYDSSNDYINKRSKKSYRKLKNKLFLILGGSMCSNKNCLVLNRCSDIRCLQIDHIYGGGGKEIKKFGALANMIRYYIEHPEEAREKLQILCANCNQIKREENKENNRNI